MPNLARNTALLTAARDAGSEYMLEHPADRANRGRPFSSTPRMLPFRFCPTSSPDAWHTKPLASPSLNAHWAR
eukprot:1946365-Pleurochrysis_carterae.AAC.1